MSLTQKIKDFALAKQRIHEEQKLSLEKKKENLLIQISELKEKRDKLNKLITSCEEKVRKVHNNLIDFGTSRRKKKNGKKKKVENSGPTL